MNKALRALVFGSTVTLLFAVAPGSVKAQSQYTITQITSGSPDHQWPAVNNNGDVVWSQQLNGFWEVYILPHGMTSPSVLNGQQPGHNYRFPVIDDAGDVLYLKDNIGGGIGLQVVLNKGGVESIVEFSSSNSFSGDHRDAGQHFGIAGNGTTISYFDFCCSFGQFRRFDVSGKGTLQCGTSACDFGSDDFPDINNNGDFIFTASGQVQKSSVANPSPMGTPIAAGILGRINNSGDVVVVSAGQVQVYLAPSYASVQPVNPGTWADINDSGLVVLQNKDSAGIQQVFMATPSSLPAPTNLSAVQVNSAPNQVQSGNQIQLTWDYPAGVTVDGFKIERVLPSTLGLFSSQAPATGSELSIYPDLGDCASGHCSFVDNAVATADGSTFVSYATYSYRVRAFQGSTNSSYSPMATSFQLSLETEMCVVSNNGQLSCSPPVFPLGAPGVGQLMQAMFAPDPSPNSTVSAVAQDFSYDHFNWISVINHDPSPPPDINGNPQHVPYLDPPLGGYLYKTGPLPMDNLPYYWNEPDAFLGTIPCATGKEVSCYFVFSQGAGGDQHSSPIALFGDIPLDPCLGPTVASACSTPPPQPEYVGFFTTLVGVITPRGANPTVIPPNYKPLASFAWYTTYNGSVGGVGKRSNLGPPTIPGIGGIFNVQMIDTKDLPIDVRTLLIQAGAQGVSAALKVDNDAPMTAAFFSGKQGTNGWYIDPVTVTLIATDIDGPRDVAATSYSVDGGALTAYTGPFTVSTDGTHTIQFSSVDLAGNSEATKTLAIKIDQAPPTITGSPSPTPNTNGWNNTNVTVSFQCADALSGLAAGSPPAPTILSTEGAGQSVAGTCTDPAGNSASATVSNINIDTTPPTVACSASPSVLWPPDNKLVPINVSVNVSDSLSGPGGFALVSVTSNDPDSGQGDIQGFANGSASTNGLLRATRLGSGTDRVYTFTYSGSDGAGNTTSCTTTVTVPHDQGHN